MTKKQPEIQFSDEQIEIMQDNLLAFREGTKAERKALVKRLVAELCPDDASEAIQSLYANVSDN